MPRKQVYGKRTNATLCSTVSTFNASSSPLRRSPRKHATDIDNVIDDFVKLELGIKDDGQDDAEPARNRAQTKPKKERVKKPAPVEVSAGEAAAPCLKVRSKSRKLKAKTLAHIEIPDSEASETDHKLQDNIWTDPELNETLSSASSTEDIDERGPPPICTISDSDDYVVVVAKRTSAKKTARPDANSKSTPVRPGRTRRKMADKVAIPDRADSVVEESPEIRYLQPLLSLCDDVKSRSAPLDFGEWTSKLDEAFAITKIAEASYGEVYRIMQREPSRITSSEESVFKLIPLKPMPSGEEVDIDEEDPYGDMSTVNSVASEVRLLKHMTSTPGFTNMRDVKVVRGRPGKSVCTAWRAYNKAQPRNKKSCFPDPTLKKSYAETQLWAVIEMQDAGSDLEHIAIPHVWGIWDVFWNVTLTLAKGEKTSQFEHRDLHMGNICVRSRMPTSDPASGKPLAIDTEPQHYSRKINFTNLETTLIDYTLSRANLNSSAPSAPEDIAYNDLDNDQAVFEGDGTQHYQYDLYRYMRATFFADNALSKDHQHPKHANQGIGEKTWRVYNPRTNVVWLHFVLHMLLMQLPSTSTPAPDSLSSKKEKIAKKAARLESRLRKLNKVLDVKNTEKTPDQDFASAEELVEWAVESGWLDAQDVTG